MKAAALGTALLLAMAAPAIEFPLSESAVREAYFLGSRRDSRTEEALARYRRTLPLPARGPHVARVELLTPYALAVLRARDAPNGYSAQQAWADYRRAPDRLLVRITIHLTPTYGATYSPAPGRLAPRPTTFWREFDFRVEQEDEPLEPYELRGRPLFRGAPGEGILSGAQVDLLFRVTQFGGAPVRIEVTTPDEEIFVVEFTPATLR